MIPNNTMKKEFIAKVINREVVDTKTYRYKLDTRHDLYHQYQIISRIPLKSLDTTAALDAWELVWSDKDDLSSYEDGWYTVKGQDVLVKDGWVLRGTKSSCGADVTAYVYKSDGCKGYNQAEVTIVDFIRGEGTLL